MIYPFIPIVLIAILVGYILYMVFSGKSAKQIRMVLYPGLFFVAIWATIYYFLLR